MRLLIYIYFFFINQAVKKRRVNSRMRVQQALRRLNQLRAEKEMLEEKQQFLIKEIRFLINLLTAKVDCKI